MRSTGGGYEITRDNAAELSAAQGAELSQPVGAEGLLRQRAAMRVVPTTPPAAAPAPTAAAAEVRLCSVELLYAHEGMARKAQK
jgi:hypothetical protein